MFTGIVQGKGVVADLSKTESSLRYFVQAPSFLLEGLQRGASVAVQGVCQTATEIDEKGVWFDAISETLDRTTLSSLFLGQTLNLERAAKWGAEIGGHLLSGHIYGKGKIIRIVEKGIEKILTIHCPPQWMKYFFSKGFIALNGVSLTLAEVDPQGTFTVCLIPETLRLTTFETAQEGDPVNIEIDAQTQILVETVERLLPQFTSCFNKSSLD